MCIMCIDYPNIVVFYRSQKIHSNYMVTVDIMLSQRRRRLAYINLLLSIPQRKHDRSTPARCFSNVGPLSQAMDQR